MANSVRPWIAEYLLSVSEEYGAQIYKAPIAQKSRVVQLVQFLTCPSESQPSIVWAIASDKAHKVPIRLTEEAMKGYTSHNGQRLSRQKTVIVSLKRYRPIFCRVPTASQGMSRDACLALECQNFVVLGSYGEACFGDPVPIDDVGDVRLWSEGLKQDGGAGNVLKNRKRELVAESTSDFERNYIKGHMQAFSECGDVLLAWPTEDDVKIFESLGTGVIDERASSPELVVSEWEATPPRDIPGLGSGAADPAEDGPEPAGRRGKGSRAEKEGGVACAIVRTMTVSVAGLGHPFLRLLALFSTKSDIRSVLCFFSFCIVLLVLAYLTNPSESSFRAYLTELSFRHHLSRLDRLDDGVDDVPFHHVPTPHPRGNQVPSHLLSLENPPLLHFGSRASVSIRTPKHVFHSFAVFTVATMLPTTKSGQRNNSSISSVITDSWYIGAFGKWWRGGIIEAWYQDVVARSNDEESWTSGILSLTTIDMRCDSSGLPLSSCSRSSPPKLRNRERSSQQTNSRCSTPPPLPKSASLPLHAARPQISCVDHPPSSQSQIKPGSSCEQINLIAIPQAPSDFPPPITELLRQVSITKATVLDLRTQLSECQNSSSQSHAHLQDKADTYRERKRREDAIKIELRSRTKLLDDSKRQAEGLKREAEKKLKSVQNTRNNASHCIAHLDERVIQLQDQIACDRSVIDQGSIQQSTAIRALADEIELKKCEVKATEEQMVFSSQSARDLESKLNKERERLEMLKHRLGARKEVMDDQRVRSWSDPSMSSSDVMDPVRVPIRREHPGCLESSLEYEMHLVGLDKPSSVVDSEQSPVSSHSEEAIHPDAFSKYVSSLADRSPSFSDTSAPREVTSSYPFISTLSDHVSWQNTSYPTEIFGHYRQDTIPPIDPSAEDDLNIERELLPTDHCSRVGAFPGLSPVDWNTQPEYLVTSPDTEGAAEHKWPPFDFNGCPKKRLNPDAKEFSLASTTSSYSTISPPDPMYEALTSHSFHADSSSTATYSPSFLRAFAPSPAERQVLQRALGGTSNTSLERLPSLGDVGTIPVSSSSTIGPPKNVPMLHRALPSWLLVPQNYKVNFSPWDDEEQDQHR